MLDARTTSSSSPSSSASSASGDRPVRRSPRVPGHPIFGSVGDLRKNRANFNTAIAQRYPEMARVRLGIVPLEYVSDPALIHEVLTTKQASFVKSPGLAVFMKPVLGKGLLSSEGSFHASQRKLIAPAFVHKRVASYAQTMAERAKAYVDGLASGATTDAAEDMMRLTLSIVGKTLFDTEVADDADEVGEAITQTMEGTLAQLNSALPIPPFVPTPTNLRTRRAVARLDAIIYRIIRERRAQGGDRGDLLSILLETQSEDGARMDDKQVRDEAMTLFLAGHETTANALAWTLYLLARNPEARAKVEAEVDALDRVPTYDDLKQLPYTLAALKEAMRLYPPAYILARRAIEPVTIGDYPLKKNAILVLNILGVHHRGDIYENPEAFVPERFLGDKEKQLPRCAYMPFGAGPRICIGNHFALMEAHILLATMARRVRYDLVSTAPVEAEPLVTLRPRGGLPMRVTVR